MRKAKNKLCGFESLETRRLLTSTPFDFPDGPIPPGELIGDNGVDDIRNVWQPGALGPPEAPPRPAPKPPTHIEGIDTPPQFKSPRIPIRPLPVAPDDFGQRFA